ADQVHARLCQLRSDFRCHALALRAGLTIADHADHRAALLLVLRRLLARGSATEALVAGGEVAGHDSKMRTAAPYRQRKGPGRATGPFPFPPPGGAYRTSSFPMAKSGPENTSLPE